MKKIFAFLFLILFSPVFLIVYIATKLEDGGSLFFVQKRLGRGRKPFFMYKFRTMVAGAEKLRAKYVKLNEANGPVFKIKNDPRFTKVGKFLSRTGLDELPQLINILKGEMSFVGPRPLPVEEAEKISSRYRERFSIMPGITSSWVVEGAHRLTFRQWMELDLKDTKEKSLHRDLLISLKTVLLMVKLFFLKTRGALFIFLLAFILSAYFTYPFVKNLDKAWIGHNDYMQNYWSYWYNLFSLKTGRLLDSNLYFSPPEFYPFAGSLTQLDLLLFPAIFLYAPLALITGNLTLSFNGAILLSFILTFISAFFSAKYFLKDKFASFFAAIVFTFSGVALTRFMEGHIEYLNKFWIPPLFAALFVFFEKPNFKKGLFLSSLFTLSLFANLQLTIFMILVFFVLGFFFAIHKFLKRKPIFPWLTGVFRGLLIGIIFLPLILHFYLPYYEFSQKEGFEREVGEANTFSARSSDYFFGHKNNTLFGNFYQRYEYLRPDAGDAKSVNYAERTLFIGFLPTALFVYLLLNLKFYKKNKVVIGSLLVFLFGIVFSAGPYLESIIVKGEPLKLPFYYLYKIFPVLAAVRTPTRIMLVVLFTLSLAISYPLRDFLRKKRKPARFFLPLFFTGILIVEFTNTFSFRTFPLGGFPEKILSGKKVLFLPYRSAYKFEDATLYLSYMTQMPQSFFSVNGVAGPAFPDWEDLRTTLDGEKFTKRWFEILNTLSVDYVVINKSQLSDDKETPLVVYEDSSWSVLDVKKFEDVGCVESGPGRFSLRPEVSEEEVGKYGLYFEVEGKSTCNLAFLYGDRYIPVSFRINSSLLRKTGYLRLRPYLLVFETDVRKFEKIGKLKSGDKVELDFLGEKRILYAN